jgi:cytochrome c5
MKLLLRLSLVLLAGIVLWSFTTKPSATTNSVIVQIQQTQPAADSIALKAGKDLYGAKCQKCHRLHKPDEYTQDKWENKVLPKMSKKAKLTDDELKSIETYLFAYSQDKVKK